MMDVDSAVKQHNKASDISCRIFSNYLSLSHSSIVVNHWSSVPEKWPPHCYY
jgi:hypothetical protein